MYNTFEFVGKIMPCKETESFKPYREIMFKDSEWGKKSISFNIVCGTNRHFLDISELINKDMSKSKIYTFGKATTDESGNKSKGEKLTINFADRLKPENIEKVAEFKKYVVDTEVPGRRYLLENAVDKFKDGTITDEYINKIGVHSLEECETALADSKKKKHEFISAYDFIDFLKKFVNSDKIKNVVFKITGNYELEYNEKDDRWYRHYVPQRIYRAADDAEQISHLNLGLTFGREAVDDTDYGETKKYHINAYISQYLSQYKKNWFSPITLTVDGNGDEKAEKIAAGFKKKFAFPDVCDRDYREIGVICSVIDGAQQVELTEDMLSDERRESLEFSLTTMEEIRKELGKDIYGDRVTDLVISGLARGYSSGAKDTEYTEKDFAKPHVETPDTDDTEDIFSDDDDDIDI